MAATREPGRQAAAGVRCHDARARSGTRSPARRTRGDVGRGAARSGVARLRRVAAASRERAGVALVRLCERLPRLPRGQDALRPACAHGDAGRLGRRGLRVRARAFARGGGTPADRSFGRPAGRCGLAGDAPRQRRRLAPGRRRDPARDARDTRGPDHAPRSTRRAACDARPCARRRRRVDVDCRRKRRARLVAGVGLLHGAAGAGQRRLRLGRAVQRRPLSAQAYGGPRGEGAAALPLLACRRARSVRRRPVARDAVAAAW